MKRFYSAILSICLSLCTLATWAAEPQWIWGSPDSATNAADGLCLFRKTFNLDTVPASAILSITCDNQYVVRINGRLVGVDEDWQQVERYEVSSILKPGENDLFVQARNLSAGPAGLLATLELQFADNSESVISTDETWLASLQKSGTWDPTAVRSKNWKTAFATGSQSTTAPWADLLAVSDTISKTNSDAQLREPFELRDGDRVLFLGNTIIEREQRYGFWEHALTTRYPDYNIVFRNLGWSGDTVFGDARARFGSQAEGFAHLEVHVHAVKPTVIISAYGSNAVFNGPEGIDSFIAGYDTLLDTLETTGSHIVLLAPLPQTPFDGRVLSPNYNRDRELYRDAIRELAKRRQCQFAELTPPAGIPLTDNGMHLTELGYWATAQAFESALGLPPRQAPTIEVDVNTDTSTATNASLNGYKHKDGVLKFNVRPAMLESPTPATIGDLEPAAAELAAPLLNVPRLVVRGLEPGDYELQIDDDSTATRTYTHKQLADGVAPISSPLRGGNLLPRIRAKNELYFHRWRPQNETYLLLFRKHEQGNNAVEIPMFDPLVADVESEIAELRRASSIRFTITKK